MKTRVLVFYAVSFLSLLLFVISPAAENQSFSNAMSKLSFSQVLVESADRLVLMKQ